jgi:uncharacterized protein YcbK (DUF882 family)
MIEIAPMITLPDFNADEFDCKHCGMNNMNALFLWKLQQARTEAQVKFIITSGYRCEEYEAERGKKSKGEHVYGEAADILTPNSHIRFKVLEAAFGAGFRRIGVGPNFIHLGNKSNFPQQVCWTYY